jgi:membrane-bound lytic murein transglycosylase D
VAFWKRIFTALDTSSGVLHDPEDVSIIYHTLHDLPESSQPRQDLIDLYRDHYRRILEQLAQGKRQNLDSDEARVLALFKGKQTPARLREAADNIRFQSGIRNRFADGLLRSVEYLSDMERIFAAAGLPPELVLLPHIESSFHNKAYSKAGAAGIWQFMPATGRRFMRIDNRVDERLNVRLATIAATKLLRENYEALGTWPLAITAYNHGANGMKQAVEAVGTDDFGIIVQRYESPMFGFASKNFYAEFLAAIEVTKQHKLYFADLSFSRSPYVGMAEASATRETTRVATTTPATAAPSTYRVKRGDTLSTIAQQFETTASTLAVLNKLHKRNVIQPGQTLVLPSSAAAPTVVARTSKPEKATPTVVARTSKPEKAAPTKQVAAKRYQVRRGDTLWSIAQRFDTTVPTLVSLNGLKQQSIKPGAVISLPSTSSQTVVTTAVLRQPVVTTKQYAVRPGDTLWSIAQRFGTTVSTLATLNGLKPQQQLKAGQVLTIPASPSQEA